MEDLLAFPSPAYKTEEIWLNPSHTVLFSAALYQISAFINDFPRQGMKKMNLSYCIRNAVKKKGLSTAQAFQAILLDSHQVLSAPSEELGSVDN